MQTIGVFFGSRSPEHDVSIVTAISSVIKPLKISSKYDVVPIYISKDGLWYSDPKLSEIETYSQGDIESLLKKLKPVHVEIGAGLKIVWSGIRTKKQNIDIAFPAMHGSYGEDGTLMGVFELANIPYVGCGVTASTVAMDKLLSKQIVASKGIEVAKYISATKSEYEQGEEQWLNKIEQKLKYPLFVKPPHLGSSIGISKVKNRNDLKNAIELALHYDNSVLIEQAIDNLIEVTLPIIGNDNPLPALLEEPLVSGSDFFSFETKYMHGGKKGKSAKSGAQGYSNIPAQITEKLYKSAQQTAIDAYRAIGCQGIARIDMLIDSKSKVVYFNEVNPLPGDLYSHNWIQAGVSKAELVQKLIDYAIERHESQARIATTFSTNYLNQF